MPEHDDEKKLLIDIIEDKQFVAIGGINSTIGYFNSEEEAWKALLDSIYAVGRVEERSC